MSELTVERRTELMAKKSLRPMVLNPQSFEQLVQFAQMAAKSTMVPPQYKGKPEDIMLAVQMGSELGLAPMQSLQNVATINGRPSVYGDALIGLCRQSVHCKDVEESITGEGDKMVAWCKATRVGAAPVNHSFSVEDAKKAGLWGKAGPWQQYPKRMLQMRARGFALRDAFPDVLRGLISAEEAGDTPPDTFKGTTIDAKPEARAHPEPTHDEPRKLTVTEWLKQLDADLANARDGEELDAILAREDVNKAQDQLRNGARDRLRHMLDTTIQRVQAMESSAPSDADREDEAPPANANPDTLPARADAFLATIGRLNKDTLPNLLKRQDYKDFVGELTVADRNDLLVRVRDATQAAQAREAG